MQDDRILSLEEAIRLLNTDKKWGSVEREIYIFDPSPSVKVFSPWNNDDL